MLEANVSLTDIRSSKFAELLFVQVRDSNAIPAYNFGWANRTATLTANSTYSLADGPRLSETYLDVTVDRFAGIRVGCQVNGSDITISERGSGGIRDWSVPINDNPL